MVLDSLGIVDCQHPLGFVAVSATGGSGGYSFVLDNGLGPNTVGYFPALTANVYAVTVTDSVGCETSLEDLNVTDLTDSVQTQETVTIYEGSYYQLPDGSRTGKAGQYPFHFETVEGCDSLHIIDLIVLDRNVYVPNVFQPNNEGLNNFFTVYSDESLDKVQLIEVYDRWGELVFRKENLLPNDEENGWDGSFRGRPVNPGVFVWVAKLIFKDGLELSLSGNVTVVR
ncbi:MAG: gliding motility-associated C-terminal domain-containing protein [Lewinellaceae bacterium]|nr:gliding motility-associated C-terminal domain-containing protein [Lewinellaceae bacterium]